MIRLIALKDKRGPFHFNKVPAYPYFDKKWRGPWSTLFTLVLGNHKYTVGTSCHSSGSKYMLFEFDKTGFPLIPLFDLGCYVQLLPVTKKQFELFVESEPKWMSAYTEACSQLPVKDEQDALFLESLFITGLLPDEIHAFADWLTPEGCPPFRILDTQTWRTVYRQIDLFRCTAEQLLTQCKGEKVRDLLQHVCALREPQTLLDISMMRNGLIEWVIENGSYAGIGMPRWEFWATTLGDPLEELVYPIHLEQRVRTFGFRLIRDFESG